mmetsp:Transcript_10400/g.22797  ORF Transcript_10400/g.22797 Transcript_10400/m.22797 type:complete len:461 (+) Transcript_10400:40-1422(+)|eukprot:CAMPEP_0204367820 /NCGR_PEP_ID=MMETSP0469-20131031/43719_1 /ASSEMBLY_ACC=CAM_ASM_000384 /TAXON_ID=2969 /ORGANISM="Oxyrrhis marina" /LENGTH=460 /DNA_ID=CAMNT_0051357291 /DNA_START=21 /DNA_END=1403 /DNA_ORIENTATION=+
MQLRLASMVFGASALRKVAEWHIPEVATLNLVHDLPGMAGMGVVGTTFGPFGKDNIFALPFGANATEVVMSTQFQWPNDCVQLTHDQATKAKMGEANMLVSWGFLFPGKRTGGVSLVDVSAGVDKPNITELTQPKDAYFYHHAEMVDMDGDGVADLVAARASKPIIFGSTDAEMVWVKNNGDGTFGDTKVVAKGPGVAFRAVDLDGDGKVEFVASEFFVNQQLAAYTCSEASWSVCAEKQSAKRIVLDNNDGPYFDLNFVDLNGDGKKDILATAQQFQDADKKTVDGKVLAFEMPAKWDEQPWVKHVLADGYLPQPKQPSGSGSPGTAVAFSMDTNKEGKLHIVLSGDDGGMVDVLSPVSEAMNDWKYTKETVYTSTGTTQQGVRTVGRVLVADMDQTGKPELYIPSYAENKLLLFSFDEAADPVAAENALLASEVRAAEKQQAELKTQLVMAEVSGMVV